jgi:DNA-binding GntR family transcriptional regulator
VRSLLERFAAVTLARQGLADTSELREQADAVTAAVKANDVPAYLEADRAFHLAFVERAGNPLLTKLIMELRDGMRLYGIESAAGRERQVASAAEHYRLIELAAAQNVDEIAVLAERHITDWQPLFAAALTRSRNGPMARGLS